MNGAVEVSFEKLGNGEITAVILDKNGDRLYLSMSDIAFINDEIKRRVREVRVTQYFLLP